MADDSIMPLLMLGGAAYLAWQYFQPAAAAGAPGTTQPASVAWTDPESSFNPATAPAAVTPQLQTTPANYTPPAPQPASSNVVTPQAGGNVFINPYWNPGGTASTGGTASPPPAAAQSAPAPAPSMCFGQCCTCQGSGCSFIPGCVTTDIETGANPNIATTQYCGPGCYIYYDAAGNVVGGVGSPGQSAGSLLAQVAG